jgi:hypothetical protein
MTLTRRGSRVSVVVSLVRRADRPDAAAELWLSVRLLARDDVGQAAEVTRLVHRLSRLIRAEINS